MATFAAWTHPKTGEVRIYVNNLPGQRSAKVWIAKQEADSFGDEWTVCVNSAAHSRGEAGNLENEAEQALKQALQMDRVKLWTDVLKVA